MSGGKGLRALMFIGSARENRLADRVSKFMVNQLKGRGWEVGTVDPVEADLPVLKKPLFFYENPAEAPKTLTNIAEKIKHADAFMLVTCEYNHCLPPGLLNLIDHFAPTSYARRPSGIVCYSPGAYGGMRAAMQARCLLGEINTPSIPNILGMPLVHEALDENGEPTDDRMVPGAELHLEQLEWYARALKNARNADSK